ncbi:MAG: N-acetylmuramoyl-L-alanine amidase [Salinimicrobium sp.]
MKHLWKFFSLLLIVISLSFTGTDKKTIIIDVGHGGSDTGNISNGISEKEVVLSIAHKIQELNKNENIEIILTRSSDKFISLEDRTEYINSLGADLMISLHLNAHHSNTKNGLELFTSKQNKMHERSTEIATKMKNALSADFSVAELKNANFLVLRNTTCPGVMVEMGFLTNDEDRKFLTSEAGQEKIAGSIYQSFN